MLKKHKFLFVLGLLAIPFSVYATSGASENSHQLSIGTIFLLIAIILLAAKMSSLVEKIGQPAVLGEILVGVVLGNLYLLGVDWLEPLRNNELIKFLAEFGVVILLFQIGLESNIAQMKKVGVRALLVACIGVIVPFLLGAFVVGPWLIPDQAFTAYLFLGAALTATSVGITARVFKDLGTLKTKEAQIVLGAAVIDDVLGLIILAVVSALITAGSVSFLSVALITLKAFAFLAGAIYVGGLITPYVSSFLSKIHTGIGMKFTVCLSFGLILAFLAERMGLAPIVGAFAAGLILDSVHFKYFKKSEIVEELEDMAITENGDKKKKLLSIAESYTEKQIESLIEPIGYFLVPIFFVMTGFDVRLDLLFDGPLLLIALGVTVAAFLGKILSGLAAGKVNKWIVGLGMVPRGEVGLIFAMVGKTLGVVDEKMFSIIVIMVIVTTLLTPPILTIMVKKSKSKELV